MPTTKNLCFMLAVNTMLKICCLLHKRVVNISNLLDASTFGYFW